MTTTRTALRSLGVLAAASGLALAGAGVASATTSENNVDGNTVSVEFTLEDNQTVDACGTVLVPPAAAAEILSKLGGEAGGPALAADLLPGDIIGGLLGPLKDIPGVHVLENDNQPFVTLTAASPSGTVSAEDVPSNLYLVANFCASDLADPDFAPNVQPALVGNPLEAIGAMSSDGLLKTGSALLQAGGDSGIGAILSSTLGGEE